MELVIITGMSGAGKSTAADCLEDMGFYCIDNLPPVLLPGFIRTIAEDNSMEQRQPMRVAIVMDVRSAAHFGELTPALRQLKAETPRLRILYLDADDKVLISCYKQSRRNHPLAQAKDLVEALKRERLLMADIRDMATDLIDSGELKGGELREALYKRFKATSSGERMSVLIQSFGFKYGVPLDCDSVMDVRFVPNPFYQAEMRDLSGINPIVHDFVFSFAETEKFLSIQEELFRFSLPFYQREGKVRFHIAVGCTGGRHRSVVIAEALAQRLRETEYSVEVSHRDIEKDPQHGL